MSSSAPLLPEYCLDPDSLDDGAIYEAERHIKNLLVQRQLLLVRRWFRDNPNLMSLALHADDEAKDGDLSYVEGDWEQDPGRLEDEDFTSIEESFVEEWAASRERWMYGGLLSSLCSAPILASEVDGRLVAAYEAQELDGVAGKPSPAAWMARVRQHDLEKGVDPAPSAPVAKPRM